MDRPEELFLHHLHTQPHSIVTYQLDRGQIQCISGLKKRLFYYTTKVIILQLFSALSFHNLLIDTDERLSSPHSIASVIRYNYLQCVRPVAFQDDFAGYRRTRSVYRAFWAEYIS
jgi:hypothetical protein